jgi:hypothetical protein
VHPDPSSGSRATKTLGPDDEVVVEDTLPTNGYYHVQMDGEEGWVYARYVRLSPPTAAAGSVEYMTATPSATAPANAVDAHWGKAAPNRTSFTEAGRTCGPVGDSADVETNRLKNRTDVPPAYHQVSIPALTSLPGPAHAPRNRTKWSAEQLAVIRAFEGTPVTAEGFLAALKPQNKGSGESTNCHWNTATATDWHMALVETVGQGEAAAVVVETTPRVRRAHPKWTTDRVRQWLNTDNPIRISGWLMYDPDHPDHIGRYRATLWEIHPITRIEVWTGERWEDLDQVP